MAVNYQRYFLDMGRSWWSYLWNDSWLCQNISWIMWPQDTEQDCVQNKIYLYGAFKSFIHKRFVEACISISFTNLKGLMWERVRTQTVLLLLLLLLLLLACNSEGLAPQNLVLESIVLGELLIRFERGFTHFGFGEVGSQAILLWRFS